MLEGLRFLRRARLLVSTFVIDIGAMVFGMPRALFPELGEKVYGGGPRTVGLLYAAPGAGALAGALLSGWVGRVSRQGRAVILAVVGWGLAIAAAGAAPWLPIALFMFAVAGAADMVSAVFRNSIAQAVIPDHLRGRMAAIFIAVVAGGPRVGDLEAGTAASFLGARGSVITGGLICLVCAAAVWKIWPELASYRPSLAGDGSADLGSGDFEPGAGPGDGPARPQLSRTAPPPSSEEIQAIIESPATILLVATDDETGEIVGTLTLCVFRIPTGVRAWIEDVITDDAARGRGVGEALSRFAVDKAAELGAVSVDLTSRPSREAANRLYQRIGFEPREDERLPESAGSRLVLVARYPSGSFLGLLAAEDLEALLAAGRPVVHRPGELVLHEGGPPLVVLAVIGGTVKLTKVSMSGREVVLELRGAGDTVGELGPSMASPALRTPSRSTPSTRRDPRRRRSRRWFVRAVASRRP